MGQIKECKVKWKDTKEIVVRHICIGSLPDGIDDEDIFFYCDTKEEFKELRNPNNNEDFFVTSVSEYDRKRRQVTVEVTVMVTMEVDTISQIDTEEAVEHLVSEMDYNFDLSDSIEKDDEIYGSIIETEIIESTPHSETEI